MVSSTQDDEVHHRKEEDALDEETKTDVDAKHEEDDKIVTSESATSQEVKDANQEVKSRGGITVASTTKTSARSLTKEEAKEREDGARSSHILIYMSRDVIRPEIEPIDHEDDSEQTLRFLSRWKAPEIPPKKIIDSSLIEQCSRPIQKQLTTSDVKMCMQLTLPDSQVRKKFQQLLDETEESRVSVYGPDGKVHEMWLGDEKKRSFGLTIGWWTFVLEYGLKECCDFLTVWMFRHVNTQKLCLAVDAIRFAFRKPVSKRISQAVFEESD